MPGEDDTAMVSRGSEQDHQSARQRIEMLQRRVDEAKAESGGLKGLFNRQKRRGIKDYEKRLVGIRQELEQGHSQRANEWARALDREYHSVSSFSLAGGAMVAGGEMGFGGDGADGGDSGGNAGGGDSGT